MHLRGGHAWDAAQAVRVVQRVVKRVLQAVGHDDRADNHAVLCRWPGHLRNDRAEHQPTRAIIDIFARPALCLIRAVQMGMRGRAVACVQRAAVLKGRYGKVLGQDVQQRTMHAGQRGDMSAEP